MWCSVLLIGMKTGSSHLYSTHVAVSVVPEAKTVLPASCMASNTSTTATAPAFATRAAFRVDVPSFATPPCFSVFVAD
jgi:hypothetical protein